MDELLLPERANSRSQGFSLCVKFDTAGRKIKEKPGNEVGERASTLSRNHVSWRKLVGFLVPRSGRAKSDDNDTIQVI